MKIKNLLFPFLAALALGGCSNDEDPFAGNGEGTENKECGYVAVNIVQPKSVDSRSGNKIGFEEGSDGENYAAKGLFFIFNSTGTAQYGDPQLLDLEGSGTKDSPAIERIYSAVLVISNARSNPADKAMQIVCVLNPPASLTYSKTTTLEDLQNKIENYDAHADNTFIMTNSVYKDKSSDKIVLGATISAQKNIKNTAAEAYNDPVDIYVERVVAKVRARTSASGFTNSGVGDDFLLNGNKKNLTIKVTGIEVANIAQKSYLFKNVTGISEEWLWDDANRRSYWETVPDNPGYGNKSYDSIAEDDFDINSVAFTEYIQPNTNDSQKSSILVTAQLLDDNKPAEIVYFGGQYYDQTAALDIIASFVSASSYWKKIGDKQYKEFDGDDFIWENNVDNTSLTWLKSYEVVAKLNPDSTFNVVRSAGGDEYVEDPDGVAHIDSLLAGNQKTGAPYKARVFTQGMCYYFVNIDHTPVMNDRLNQEVPYKDHYKDGVVRNHIYDLTLSAISGIGVPVFDPKDKIIPVVPDSTQTFFLSARVNVLDWRVVQQTVKFEGN